MRGGLLPQSWVVIATRFQFCQEPCHSLKQIQLATIRQKTFLDTLRKPRELNGAWCEETFYSSKVLWIRESWAPLANKKSEVGTEPDTARTDPSTNVN